MSNLKNLREVLKQINEKKDPILNMYLGDLRHSFFMENSENDASLEILSTSGKAKVDVEVIEVSPLKKEYEISIKRLLNKEKALEVTIYNTKEQLAVSKKYKKLDDAVELTSTTVKTSKGIVDEITSNTATYSFDRLELINPLYNYEKEPVQILSAVLYSILSTSNLEPDNKVSFVSSSINTNGRVEVRTQVEESGNKHDETTYPYTDQKNVVLNEYDEYLNGNLRPSVVFASEETSRNK